MIKLNPISQDDIGISHPSVQQNTPESEQTLITAPVLHALLEPLTFPNGDFLTCIRQATAQCKHQNRNFCVALYYDLSSNKAHWTYMPWDQDQDLDLIHYFAPILVQPNRTLKPLERYLHFYTTPHNIQYITRADFDHVEHIVTFIQGYNKLCETKYQVDTTFIINFIDHYNKLCKTKYQVDTAFMHEIMDKLYHEDIMNEPRP